MLASSVNPGLRLTVCTDTAGSRQSTGSVPRLVVPTPPVMPDSLLSLGMLLTMSSPEVSSIAEAIRCDLGLVIALLRCAEREVFAGVTRMPRIEELVVHVGIAGLRTVVDETLVLSTHSQRSEELSACHGFWLDSYRTALATENLASESLEMSRGTAYLAGMFYRLAELPEVLGWKIAPRDIDRVKCACRLAEAWGLPEPVTELITLVARRERVFAPHPLLSLVQAAASSVR